MKKIEAIIKPYRLDQVKTGLEELGLVGMTVSEVLGCRLEGRTPGGEGDPLEGCDPCLKVEVVVPENLAEDAARLITAHGKVTKDRGAWVVRLVGVVRIRTEEEGERAL